MDFDANLEDFVCGLEEENSMGRNAVAFLKSYARTTTLFNAFTTLDAAGKEDVVRKYFDFCYERQSDGKLKKAKNPVSISLDEQNFESITSKVLPNIRKASLSTVILVEFFTHCCINCIHSIEDVRKVHEAAQVMFGRSKNRMDFECLKVLSIHSPKFPREKDLDSIKSFCKRMKMDHSDVVNDPSCILWNDFGVTCWPTLLLLGPNPDGSGPNLLCTFMGEGHKEDLSMLVKTSLEYFGTNLSVSADLLNEAELNKHATQSLDNSLIESQPTLSFPGKVVVHKDMLVIADSGSNRLIIMRPSGQVMDIVGGPERGNRDGSFYQAKFYNPQGIAFLTESVMFVADTGNHSIRRIDLDKKEVSTLVNSEYIIQMGDDETVTLKSPWDLDFYDSHTLIIAAAGNHRLLGYFFKKSQLFGVEHEENTFAVVAGSGKEENRNNSYTLKASFAQPSGLIVRDGDEKCVYIADSESSSVRSVTAKGQVVGLVGGSRDPTDLFAYGDMDGKGLNVKLQHPMGVCCGWSPTEIFIADTYNHKIKRIDTSSKECLTVVSAGLNEPSGICRDPLQGVLYVADTNNHCVQVIEPRTGSMQMLDINLPVSAFKSATKYDKLIEIDLGSENKSTTVNIYLFPLPEMFEGGQWRIISDSVTNCFNTQKGNITKRESDNNGCFSFDILEPSMVSEFFIVLDIFFCRATSCLKLTRKIKIICTKKSSLEMNQVEEFSFAWKDLVWDN